MVTLLVRAARIQTRIALEIHECRRCWAFLLFSSSAAGTAQYQLAAWVVEDLEAEVAHLRGRGVVFEEYDSPGLRTVDGVATTPVGKAAWFKDSEGNLLTMTQVA